MKRTHVNILRLSILLVAGSMVLGGCKAKKPRQSWWDFWRPKATAEPIYGDTQYYAPPPPPVAPDGYGEGEHLLDVSPEGEPLGYELTDPTRQEPSGPITALQTVYFAFDSATLQPTEKDVLDRNAEYLRQNPDITVLIEGHCDERGTPDYNLNLGQRRADRVREYLIGQGIDPGRLSTITYGEERPVALGNTEQDYALNRRSQFLVF